jgi:biopolymer transport protein ExbD
MRQVTHTASLSIALTRAREASVRSLLVGFGVILSSLTAMGAAAQSSAAFVLRVDSQGSYFLADGGSLDEAAVVEQAAVALSRDADVALVVEGDTAAPQQSVVLAAALLQQAGAKKISFRTTSADQR